MINQLRRRFLAVGGSLPFLSGMVVSNAASAVGEDEAVARRDRSHARLNLEGVRINAGLPVIETRETVVAPSADAVLRRYFALMLVTHRALAGDPKLSGALRAKFEDRVAFSPRELAFFDDPAPSARDITQFSWACEPAFPMAWALGQIEVLGRPDQECDLDALAAKTLDDGGRTLAAIAALRSIDEILDEADLIYRYHWAVRQAGLDGDPDPAGLNGGVVMERHRGLNWLIGYEAEWDEVTTDT